MHEVNDVFKHGMGKGRVSHIKVPSAIGLLAYICCCVALAIVVRRMLNWLRRCGCKRFGEDTNSVSVGLLLRYARPTGKDIAGGSPVI